MKLTPELLAQAPASLNPSKERQLDLRGVINHCHDVAIAQPSAGYKIPAIENLGVTRVRVFSSRSESCASVFMFNPYRTNMMLWILRIIQ